MGIILTLHNVFYIPDSKNLLSHSQAEVQVYAVQYQKQTGNKVYEMWKDGEKLLEVGQNKYDLSTFKAHNAFSPEGNHVGTASRKQDIAAAPTASITVVDRAANLQRRHERLGHLCLQYTKMLINRDLVTGMMLQQRLLDDCIDCRMRKERKPSPIRSWSEELSGRTIFCSLICCFLIIIEARMLSKPHHALSSQVEISSCRECADEEVDYVG